MPEQTQHKTLSIGKYCAGVGFGVPGVGGVVMVMVMVVTGTFGTSDCSMSTVADSWPHPGLVSFPTSLTLNPAGVACRGWFQ